MKQLLLGSALALLSLAACASQTADSPKNTANSPLSYVDPLIGTGGHGHTFPGAVVPFGMVQLSPDNPSKGWDWTSGYHYSDDTLLGFSHTHLSGTGVGDMLDLLVMPFRGDYLKRERDDKGRIFTKYSHQGEVAQPGYYALELPAEQVKAELTASARVGVHHYSFSGGQDAQLLLDLGYAQNFDKPVTTFIRVENDHTIVGYRVSTGWAKLQPLYFVAHFNQPFSYQLYQAQKPAKGEQLQAEQSQIVLNFGQPKTAVEAQMALSYTSIAGAKRNLAAETAGKNFAQVKAQAQQAWAAQLGRFAVVDDNKVNKTKFYTALYHSFLAPQLFSDVDGAYLGADGATHTQPGYQRHSLFSLWDTFRALHPLLTLSNPERVDDMVKSMLGFYDETGLLPSWDLMSNETDVMIGYHAVPVIVDAYLKGLTSADPEHLLRAVKASAMQNKFGTDLYRQYGYIPSELELEAVSKTLEYAFDDAAIARLAQAMGKTDDAALFSKRALSYRQLFDSSTGFMRGKTKEGQWVSPFSPTYVAHRTTDYTEANAWQYNFFVPHDVEGMMALYPSEQAFLAKLDELFTTKEKMHGDVSPDITGLIGQYAHGNEPVHHVAYLYAFTSAPEKGQHWLRHIRDTMYKAEPDGLAGNDDVGQMSAWYVFSALGFYPVNPVDDGFVRGLPQFRQVQLSLPGGKSLTIRTEGDLAGTVQSWQLNGQPLGLKVNYQQLMQGGELVFRMSK
ncbi:GH92 family glycosyl hydrolase [Rheinheimera marina]|uniref:GH92 family glycosyl hydrolase n=1 Tax=Rheinheimera marina TaxID=1774958 RepID=A0ABV9JHE3_9GAMM